MPWEVPDRASGRRSAVVRTALAPGTLPPTSPTASAPHGSHVVQPGRASPSFVRAPEGNGCAARLIRTLKEQLLWVRTFATVEELRLALAEWAELYNLYSPFQRPSHQNVIC